MVVATSAAVAAIAASNAANASHARRNCITVDGKLFCEESQVSGREAGIFVIGVVAVIAWIVLATWLSCKLDKIWIGVAMLLGPPLVIGIASILFG